MPIPVLVPLIMMGASAIANGIRSGVQGSKARSLERDFLNKDNALQPVSPDQYANLARTRQLERSMRLGTDPSSQFAKAGLTNALAQTQNNLVRSDGGVGTVNNLLRSQTGFTQGMAGVSANAMQGANQMHAYGGGLIDNIQKNIYDLQMKRRNYAQLKAVEKRQAANDSMTAAIGSLAQAATLVPTGTPDVGVPKAAIQPPPQALAPTTWTGPSPMAGQVTTVPTYQETPQQTALGNVFGTNDYNWLGQGWTPNQ